MSFQNPAFKITRWSVVGMEGMWAKMWDPPTSSPATTDKLPLTPQTVPDGKSGTSLIRPNPVPEVMAAAGFIVNALGLPKPTLPHTVQRSLLHGLKIPTWDGAKQLNFFTLGDPDVPAAANGTYPGPTVRVPRSAIYNAQTQGQGPPPHTIHWHGIEPTPINDGVGHCSMEIGQYTYQWQPNFTGTYFYHCHRNTMQHFEFGLFGIMPIETPDAFFGSIASTNVDGSVVLQDLTKFPIGCGRDGKRRTAANLSVINATDRLVAPIPFWKGGLLTDPDPGPGLTDTQISFPTDPHAMTVVYDVEAIWVLDDRDSVWSDLAPDARCTFPSRGNNPGIDDQFTNNPGVNGFFAFNDFNADYWFVTGVPVPAHKGGTGTLPPNVEIPPALNSGISGTQVSINAATGQTIFIRCLDAAYNSARVTFPVDVVIIEWDGRAHGVPPYAHNHAYTVKANTPIETSTARRFGCLINESSPITSTVKVEFINNRGQNVSLVNGNNTISFEEVVVTALIPINIGGPVIAPPVFAFLGEVVDQLFNPCVGLSMTVRPLTQGGSPIQAVVTDAAGNYTFSGMVNGSYEITPNATGSSAGKIFSPASVTINCNNNNVTIPVFSESIATFAPNSYTLPDALNSLRDVVGLRQPTNFEKFRYDVAPLLPTPGDGIIDIRDSLNILRMVVGLPPQ